MTDAELVQDIAAALLADWREQHRGASGLALASAGVGAVRAAKIAVQIIRMQERERAA